MSPWRIVFVVATITLIASSVSPQQVVLRSPLDRNLELLIAGYQTLNDQEGQYAPPDVRSPDAVALALLDGFRQESFGDLLEASDLLGVYDNFRSAGDKDMMKPLLQNRLRLAAGLLDASAHGAEALLTGGASLESTRRQALELRDELRTLKGVLDAARAPLK